ncbi:astacin-like metalloprotease toxin 5 [Oppia nitens]|uniref:astacin-like metalloprotease toxin 5 n=1 Tax=Oppia nitens TaxID=1686743 RepID=UPI0023D9D3AF|nr:astacin-like metalloprotease toxin 5 [Oppia nitens]
MTTIINDIIGESNNFITFKRQNNGQQNQRNQRNQQKSRKNSRSSQRASGTTTPLWPNGLVYYRIDNSLSSHRRLIQNAMKNIESRSCVKFRQRTNQNNYIQFFKGDGCYSTVGKAGGRQYLSLGTGCHDIGSAMHEILHALGFYHEHMRSDRDQFITIHWNNIENGMQDQFQKISTKKNKIYTKFDYNSIMIYGNTAFSKNGKNTMTAKAKGVRLIESHFKRHLSPLDVQTLNLMYKCNK